MRCSFNDDNFMQRSGKCISLTGSNDYDDVVLIVADINQTDTAREKKRILLD